MLDELLRAVLENPDDDAARIVYADALQIAGDPRGELIANEMAGTEVPPRIAHEAKARWLQVPEPWRVSSFGDGVELSSGNTTTAAASALMSPQRPISRHPGDLRGR